MPRSLPGNLAPSNRPLIQDHWRRQWHPTLVLLPGGSHGRRSLVGCSPWVVKSRIRLSDFTFTFHFPALEKEMATHFSVLAWRIPGTGEPRGLPSMGSHRVRHNWSDLAAAAIQDHRPGTPSSLFLSFSLLPWDPPWPDLCPYFLLHLFQRFVDDSAQGFYGKYILLIADSPYNTCCSHTVIY